MEITAVVKGAWDAFATKIKVFLPKLIGAIIIFVAGLINPLCHCRLLRSHCLYTVR